MKKGKVSEAVLKRSVLRPFAQTGVLDAASASFGEDCAFFSFWGGEKSPDVKAQAPGILCATAVGTAGGCIDRTLSMLVAEIANNLSTGGAELTWLMLDILYPQGWEEAGLKAVTKELAQVCERLSVRIAGGHTQISEAVNFPAVTLTGFGFLQEGTRKRTANLKPGWDLVMTGYAGWGGTAVIARRMEEQLKKRYPYFLVQQAKEFDQRLLIGEAARAASRFGAGAMHDVSQGGIFGALWEMSECAGVGLEVDLKKIPIRQETIEICEFFGLNPYQLYGQGSLLIGTEKGDTLVLQLAELGILAAVIGKTTAGNDRILKNGEDIRFLDRPAQDALWILKP